MLVWGGNLQMYCRKQSWCNSSLFSLGTSNMCSKSEHWACYDHSIAMCVPSIIICSSYVSQNFHISLKFFDNWHGLLQLWYVSVFTYIQTSSLHFSFTQPLMLNSMTVCIYIIGSQLQEVFNGQWCIQLWHATVWDLVPRRETTCKHQNRRRKKDRM